MKQEISQNDILKQYLIAHSQSPGTPSVRYNSSLETQKPIIRFAYLKKKKKKTMAMEFVCWLGQNVAFLVLQLEPILWALNYKDGFFDLSHHVCIGTVY